MTYRWFVADLRTGGDIVDLPGVMAGSSWNTTLNAPETLRCELNMADPRVRDLGVRGRTYPGRVILACAEGDRILAAGPVWARRYDRSEQKATLAARGMWSYFDHRFVLALLAATIDTDKFSVIDPDDKYGQRRMGNPALRTNLTGLALGTMAKRLVQQARLHTGGDVPVVFQDDESGDWGRAIDAFEFENVGGALRDITKMEGGVDLQFRPQFTPDGQGIEFLLRTGTNADPLLAGGPHVWNFTAPMPPGAELVIEDDASSLASRAWSTGGKSGGRVLVSRVVDERLLDLGFALFEALDSHSSVDEQRMLDHYAAELTNIGFGASEAWSFAAERNARPRVGTYDVGDWADLNLSPFDESTLRGDPWVPEGGLFRQRIIGLEGQDGRETITVTCAPMKE